MDDKRTLRKLRKQQRQLGLAENARQAGQYKKALSLLDKIIDSLEQETFLIPAQKECLGSAYQSRAKIRLIQGSFGSVHSDIEKVRQFLQPDIELIGGMADSASSNNYDSSITLEYCLEYLSLLPGKPADNRFRRINTYLEKHCSVNASTSIDQATHIKEVARKILSVDAQLAWAHRAQGQAMIVLEQWDDALTSLETSIRLSPEDKLAQFALGQVYQRLGRYPEARRVYEESLQLDNNQDKVAHALGSLLLDEFGKKELNSASSWLQQAARNSPDNAIYQYDWGRVCMALMDWENAQSAFELALNLDKDSLQTRRSLADLFYQQGKWQAALPHYEILHNANKDDLSLLISLSICLVELKFTERAIELISSHATNDSQALYVLGRAHLRLGQYEAAIEELQDFIRIQSDNGEALYYLGCAYAWLGAAKDPSYYKKALKFFDKAVEADPSLVARANLQIGHVYLRQDRLEEAAKFYREVTGNPELELFAETALIRVYLANGQTEDADTILKKLKKYKSTDVKYISGLTAEMQGDFEEAEKAYRQTRALGSLGVILYKQGKTQEAVSALQQAREHGDDSDRVLYYSGLCHFDMDLFEEAVSEWELLAKRHPDHTALSLNLSRTWYRWGCNLYLQGKYDQAAEAWESLFQIGDVTEEMRGGLQQLYLLAAYHENSSSEKKNYLQRARELGAKDMVCDYILALGHLTDSDLEGAFPTLTKLVKKDSENPILNYNVGVVELAMGKGQEAVEHFNKARDPDNSELTWLCDWGLVAALGSTGRWKDAAKVLENLWE